jgi:DNA-directed RNA polymerase beta' subunit
MKANNRPLRCLTSRLKALARSQPHVGKRGSTSARSVITPDLNISVGELGSPSASP